MRNPLNLFDMMIGGAPMWSTVGTVDGEPISTVKLDKVGGEPFTRLGNQIYVARERAYRWLVERAALERLAKKRKMKLLDMLIAEYKRLPEPTEAQMEASDPEKAFDVLTPEDKARAQRSAWRWKSWEILRSVLVQEGLEGMTHKRVAFMIVNPEWADHSQVAATIDGVDITRAELRSYEGFKAELAREEYVAVARREFDRYVDTLVLEREAKRRKMGVDDLVRDFVGKISDAQVRAYIKEHPDAGKHPKGLDGVRQMMIAQQMTGTRAALTARLRGEAKVQFLLEPHEFPTAKLDPIDSRVHGSDSAKHTLVVMHGLACGENCVLGAFLIKRIVKELGDELRLVSADSFRRNSIASLRHANALYCAREQDQWWPFFETFGGVEKVLYVTEIAKGAAELGMDEAAFLACMDEDRYLPQIWENVILGERLGLERAIPGFFFDGVRLKDLGKYDKVRAQIQKQL